MASRTPPPNIKRDLIQEAGNKCANPGCSNKLIEIHHIKEWYICKTHNKKHMVAICPSCHDAVTRGQLKIDDKTIYRWKTIIRSNTSNSHIYVEPGSTARLLLGSITYETGKDVFVFNFANKNSLKIQVNGDNPLLIDILMNDSKGNLIVKVSKNYINYKVNEDIEVRERPGKFQIAVSKSTNLIPQWVIDKYSTYDPAFSSLQEYILLNIEAIEPGLIQVYGIWIGHDTAIVATPSSMSHVALNREKPITLIGEGKKTIFKWVGSINETIFQVAQQTFL